MSDDRVGDPCTHDVIEREVAASADGLCPLCLRARLAQAQESDNAWNCIAGMICEALAPAFPDRRPFSLPPMNFDTAIRQVVERLAQAERERDTALYDAKGCAKASLMIAGDFAKAEARAQRLEAALREIASRGPVFDAKGTWSKEVCEIAREALASSPSPRAEARQDGALDPEMPR